GGAAVLADALRGRNLVIGSLVVALVVLAGILALVLNNGGGADAKGGDKGASSGATAGADDKNAGSGDKDADKGEDKGSGDDKKPSGSASASDSASPGESASASTSPSGDAEGKSGTAAKETYKHSQGFSIGLPKGWKYVRTEAAGARFTGPDGQRLLVGWTTSPKSDPVADWQNQERGMRRPQYHRVRIASVDYRDWKTADWEFTYADGGTKWHSIDRGTVVNGSLGYGLMYTAKDSDWGGEQRKTTWKTFTQTFKPKS
ncbi:serine/threonine protein kinase, partial [Streptomyces endophyticus]|nr:serine/threonine protein kinase [Streptomyces endophyticus]